MILIIDETGEPSMTHELTEKVKDAQLGGYLAIYRFEKGVYEEFDGENWTQVAETRKEVL